MIKETSGDVAKKLSIETDGLGCEPREGHEKISAPGMAPLYIIGKSLEC